MVTERKQMTAKASTTRGDGDTDDRGAQWWELSLQGQRRLSLRDPPRGGMAPVRGPRGPGEAPEGPDSPGSLGNPGHGVRDC